MRNGNYGKQRDPSSYIFAARGIDAATRLGSENFAKMPKMASFFVGSAVDERKYSKLLSEHGGENGLLDIEDGTESYEVKSEHSSKSSTGSTISLSESDFARITRLVQLGFPLSAEARLRLSRTCAVSRTAALIVRNSVGVTPGVARLASHVATLGKAVVETICGSFKIALVPYNYLSTQKLQKATAENFQI